MSGRLYVGIDLGTFQSTIASSAGAMHSIETVVGRPKDPVARNFLKRDVLFGADALKNKLACNLYRPMALELHKMMKQTLLRKSLRISPH